MHQPYKPPSHRGTAYHCPRCHAYAQQLWTKVTPEKSTVPINGLELSLCSHCEGQCVWVGENMIYPRKTDAPPPNDDLPSELRADYEEAASVLSISPRAAAALLRLVLQKLCVHLGEKGKVINDDIAALVQKGLPAKLQKMFDMLRIVGNAGVHPSELRLEEDPDLVMQLFTFINLIVEDRITRPREIEEAYAAMPQSARDAVEKRDSKKETA